MHRLQAMIIVIRFSFSKMGLTIRAYQEMENSWTKTANKSLADKRNHDNQTHRPKSEINNLIGFNEAKTNNEQHTKKNKRVENSIENREYGLLRMKLLH